MHKIQTTANWKRYLAAKFAKIATSLVFWVKFVRMVTDMDFGKMLLPGQDKNMGCSCSILILLWLQYHRNRITRTERSTTCWFYGFFLFFGVFFCYRRIRFLTGDDHTQTVYNVKGPSRDFIFISMLSSQACLCPTPLLRWQSVTSGHSMARTYRSSSSRSETRALAAMEPVSYIYVLMNQRKWLVVIFFYFEIENGWGYQSSRAPFYYRRLNKQRN